MLTLGVDVGASKVSAALVKNGRAQGSCKLSYPAKRGSVIRRVILQCVETAKGKAKISGIGLGVPCAIDSGGKTIACANIPRLSPEKLILAIRKKFGVPVAFENDVKAAALAELRYGIGRRSKNFVFVALGTGIGGAIVIDGKLYKGALGWAGEFGHTIMQIKNEKLKMKNLEDWEEMSTKRFFKSKKGPKDIAEFARTVGLGLLNITYAFAPEIIVIGGGLSSLWNRRFEKAVRSAMFRMAVSRKMPLPKIMRSRFGENAGVIGAALLDIGSKSKI